MSIQGNGYVLAFNSSPRKDEGFTDIVLRRFMAGAEAESVEVETVYLAEKKIADCLGCTYCWFKTPGVCRHKDDVPELHEKMQRADVLVYATPLYISSMSGIMKSFLDRIMPMAEPYQEYEDGVCRHPHGGNKDQRTVLLSTCGFPGLRNFDPLVLTFQRIVEIGGSALHAAVLFPSSVLLVGDPCPAEEQLDYVYKAGREVMGEGIRAETVEGYSKPYVDPEVYVEDLNTLFRNLRENI
ncbi:MAG: flavodoxin family protein [Actinomycetota bacterium]|nr:flavodoxin family protein [Actinomycetota bacterium]